MRSILRENLTVPTPNCPPSSLIMLFSSKVAAMVLWGTLASAAPFGLIDGNNPLDSTTFSWQESLTVLCESWATYLADRQALFENPHEVRPPQIPSKVKVDSSIPEGVQGIIPNLDYGPMLDQAVRSAFIIGALNIIGAEMSDVNVAIRHIGDADMAVEVDDHKVEAVLLTETGRLGKFSTVIFKGAGKMREISAGMNSESLPKRGLWNWGAIGALDWSDDNSKVGQGIVHFRSYA